MYAARSVQRAFVLLLGCVACGDNIHPPRLLMDVSDEAPAYGRAPFPTDALRAGPKLGLLRGVDAFIGLDDKADLVAAHLAQLDGFGLRPTVEFFIQGAIDPATVPATTRALTDSVFVLEVDPATLESGAPIAFDWRYDADRSVIAGSPAMGVQLREGTRYAAVLTDEVTNPEGLPVTSSFQLGLLGQDPPQRWRTSAEAYEELLGLSGLEARIVGLAVFTTQRASDTLVKARNEIANTAAVAPPILVFDDPALIFDSPSELTALFGTATRDTTGPRQDLEQWGSDNPTGIAHDHVQLVATGRTTIARFVGDDTGTNGPDDETFSLGADGVPAVRETASIPITIVLPRGSMPPNGFPVVIYGHGFGGSRHDMLALAQPITEQGYALIAIDMHGHGSRYNATDIANNFAKDGFTGTPTLRDGFGDDVGTSSYLDFFEGFQNFGAIRDSIRQSALDFARVAMLVRSKPDLDIFASVFPVPPRLDPDKVAFLGESLGSIVGVDLAAIEPSIGLYVLNVPGGGLVDYILPNSAQIGDVAHSLSFTENLYRTQGTLDRFHPLVGILQAIVDGADSLTFARRVLRDRVMVENKFLSGRHVVCLEVLNDETMPNVSTEALARAFGLHTLRPNVDPPMGLLQIESPGGGNVNAQTAILVQYGPATHGSNWSAQRGTMEYEPGYPHPGDDPFPRLATPITIHEPIYETHEQIAEILSTYFAGMTPRVRSTKPPVARLRR